MMTSEKKKTRKTPDKRKTDAATVARRRLRARTVMSELVKSPQLSVGQAIQAAGLPPTLAGQPARITSTPEWNELLDEYLPRTELLDVHKGLLRASRIESIEFPLGHITDEEIRATIAQTGCTVRKIITGEKLYTVYFFAPDNRARKDALEMAYKLRGDFAADKAAAAFSLVALARLSDGGSTPDTLPAHVDHVQLPTRILE